MNTLLVLLPEMKLRPPARRRVFELIAKRPGISMSELARAADLHWTSAALHVEHLERAGLVRTARVGRLRVLQRTDHLQESISGAAILGEPSCRRVAMAVAHSPDARVWELASLAGMSDRATYHHLKRLVEAGLVSTRKRGGYRGIEATPLLRAYLSTHERA